MVKRGLKNGTTAADAFVEERKLHVSERANQLDRERLRPLRMYFGERLLIRITASDVAACQWGRLDGTIRLENGRAGGVGNRTVNMELNVLRLLLKTPLHPTGAATNIHDPALAEEYNAWEKVRERQDRRHTVDPRAGEVHGNQIGEP
jgi:hypothetical protein